MDKNDLQAQALQFLPTVADAYVLDPKTDDVIFTSFANTDTSVQITTETNDKVAGVGGAKLFTVTSGKNVAVTLTTIDFRLEYFAVNLGQKIHVGGIDVQSGKETYVAENGSITLKNTPADGKVHLETSSGYVTIEGVTGKAVDLSAYGIIGECVSVIYVYATTARYVNIAADTQPLIAKLILETPIYNNAVGEIGKLQYKFPSFQFSGNINSSLTSNDSGTIEMSGSPNSTQGNACGEGSIYGQIIEILYDTTELTKVSTIALQPNEIELSMTGTTTSQLKLFGLRGSELINDKIELDITATNLVSDAPATATVSTSGLVTAVAAGTAIITATYNGIVTTSEVTVIA